VSFHIEITANDAERTVVYSGDVEDFDLAEGPPLRITVGRSAAFSGEGDLGADVKPVPEQPRWRRRWGR
jgi:hypothetical protein